MFNNQVATFNYVPTGKMYSLQRVPYRNYYHMRYMQTSNTPFAAWLHTQKQQRIAATIVIGQTVTTRQGIATVQKVGFCWYTGNVQVLLRYGKRIAMWQQYL